MTDEELRERVRRIARETFGRDFDGTAVYNRRFKTRGGDVDVRRSLIRVSSALEEKWGAEVTDGIIKHELCHLFLFCDGRPYSHRASEFKRLLSQVGAPMHLPRELAERRKARYIRYYYRCPACGSRFAADRRGRLDCPACRKARLVMTGKRRTIHPLRARTQ